MEIVEELNNVLKNKGITHQQLAEKLSTTRQNVSRFLSTDDMKLSLFQKICMTCELKPNDFVNTGPGATIVDILYMPKYREMAHSGWRPEQAQEKVSELYKRIADLEQSLKDKQMIIDLLQNKK